MNECLKLNAYSNFRVRDRIKDRQRERERERERERKRIQKNKKEENAELKFENVLRIQKVNLHCMCVPIQIQDAIVFLFCFVLFCLFLDRLYTLRCLCSQETY